MYSDEEFALILRKAAELATPSEPLGRSAGGLTLAEMKAAASEAGFDPDLVERAARLLPASSASASFFERLIGGQLQLKNEAWFRTVLSEPGAAKLLSALLIDVDPSGKGHSGATGMTWRSSGDIEIFMVTARPDEGGTAVTVALDRGGTLAVTGTVALIGSFMAALAGIGLGSELGPAIGVPVIFSGIGGVLAIARHYWASSTRTARDRIGLAMDAVSQSLKASAVGRGLEEHGAATRTDVETPAGPSSRRH